MLQRVYQKEMRDVRSQKLYGNTYGRIADVSVEQYNGTVMMLFSIG